MNTSEAVRERILELCAQRGWTVNALANISGVSASTVKNIINGSSKNPGIVTIKMLCDGFEISLSEFFSTDVFKKLEQEIK